MSDGLEEVAVIPILIRTSRENIEAVEAALRQILYCDKYDGKGCGRLEELR